MGGIQQISILKKSVNFVQKIGSRNCNFCICIFEFINQSANSCWILNIEALYWRQLPQKIWRIKAQIIPESFPLINI